MFSKKNEHGAIGTLIIVVVVLVAALGGVGFYVFNSQKDDSTESSATEQSTKDSASTPASEKELIAIEKAYDLSFVCEGTGWPSNVTPSSTKKRVQQFTERDGSSDSYTNSGFASLATQYNIDTANELAVDYVACLEITDTQTATVTCTFRDTTATMNVKDYKLTVYNLATKEAVISGQTIAGDSTCPSSALIRNGAFTAPADRNAPKQAIEQKI